MFKNYSLLHVGRGDPDHLMTESVSEELFEKYCNSDYQIQVGGGFNGIYLFVPAELRNVDTGEFEGCDDTVNEFGITDIVTLMSVIQDHMNWDGGNYISKQFMEKLQATATPSELEAMKFTKPTKY